MAAPAAAPLRQRSYFEAGEKNTGEHYNASVAVNPFRYKPGSNYESSNAGNGGNSRPQLRIPKTKNAGEIHKANEEPQVARNFHTDYATMEEAYNSTMEEFAPHFREIDDDEQEAFETSIFTNLDRVYEDGTNTLQLLEGDSLGHTFVTIAIAKINDGIPARDRMYMFGLFRQVLNNNFRNNNNNNNNNNSSSSNNSRKNRKSRKQRNRKQRNTRKQRN